MAWIDAAGTLYPSRVSVETYLPHGRSVRPLYAEQPAPVAVTLSHVLTAYDYAESHPHKYLCGTSNWCAAVAYKLNGCLDELKRLNTSRAGHANTPPGTATTTGLMSGGGPNTIAP